MFITPHVLVGTFIYKGFEKLFKRHDIELKMMPLLCLMVLFLAFGSHFLLDNIPHTEYTIPLKLPAALVKISPDAILSIVLFLIAIGCYPSWQNIKKEWLTFLAGFLGILPDVITNSSDIFNLHLWFHNFHDQLHTTIRPTFWIGIWTQLVTVIIAVLWLRYLTRTKTQ